MSASAFWTPTVRQDNVVDLAASAKRLKAMTDQKLQERRNQRQAYQGTCFDCQDTGWLWADKPCPHCDKGEQEEFSHRSRQVAKRSTDFIHQMGTGIRYRDFTLTTFPRQNQKILDAANDFLDHWDNRRGLVFIGPYGIGKTGILVAMLKVIATRMAGECTNQGNWRYTSTPIRMTTLIDLLGALRASYADNSYESVARQYRECPILFIDDLGRERISHNREYVVEQLFAIVNHRYDHQLPIFATSNLPINALEARLDGSITSRLEEMCHITTLTGVNLRKS